MTVSNGDDLIDSRDVIERIGFLQSLRDEEGEDFTVEDAEELSALLALQEVAEGSPDWEYGETLIRDSYFVEYAEQLAIDIGAINSQDGWPLSYIDWDQAAEALKMDYSPVDFGGVTYWIRA